VVDEITAYRNGLLQDPSDEHCRKCLLEMLRYGDALVRAIEKHDSNYAEMEKLKWFLTHLSKSLPMPK
jgi:hypothetical protein